MTNLYLGGEDLPDDYTYENGAEYNIENKDDVDRDTHDHDMTYENEGKRDLSPMGRISVGEYDKLRDQTKYITDPTLIGYIDKMEFFLKEIRKHIVRKY